MIWIELLGPAGVGKSYIYEQLSKRNKELIGFNLGTPETDLLSKLRMWITRGRKKIRQTIISDWTENELLTIESFLKGIDILYEHPLLKLEIYGYFYYRIKQLKHIFQSTDKNAVYLAEDGILH